MQISYSQRDVNSGGDAIQPSTLPRPWPPRAGGKERSSATGRSDQLTWPEVARLSHGTDPVAGVGGLFSGWETPRSFCTVQAWVSSGLCLTVSPWAFWPQFPTAHSSHCPKRILTCSKHVRACGAGPGLVPSILPHSWSWHYTLVMGSSVGDAKPGDSRQVTLPW